MLLQYLQRKLPMVPARVAYSWALHRRRSAWPRAGDGEGPAGTRTTFSRDRCIRSSRPCESPRASPAFPRPGHSAALVDSQGRGWHDAARQRRPPLPPALAPESLRVLAGVTYVGTAARAKAELGWAPRPLREGLMETLRHEMRLLGMDTDVLNTSQAASACRLRIERTSTMRGRTWLQDGPRDLGRRAGAPRPYRSPAGRIRRRAGIGGAGRPRAHPAAPQNGAARRQPPRGPAASARARPGAIPQSAAARLWPIRWRRSGCRLRRRSSAALETARKILLASVAHISSRRSVASADTWSPRWRRIGANRPDDRPGEPGIFGAATDQRIVFGPRGRASGSGGLGTTAREFDRHEPWAVPAAQPPS